MANTDSVTAVVIDKKETTMTSSKTGKEFTSVELTADNGITYSGYDNQVDPSVIIGSKTVIISTTITKQDGSTIHKLISAKPATPETGSAGKTSTWRRGKTAGNASAAPQAQTTNVVQQPSNKGARTGGVLHDAVAIAIRNSEVSGTEVSLDEVETVAKALLDLAANLEK